MLMDVPPQLQERVICSIAAAVKYDIPANIMLAIAEKEGGRVGQWVGNANGTYDVGPLQFNTGYLRQLSGYGITPADVAAAGCYPYELAAWRLRQHIKKDAGDLWTRCANYHSRTPLFNSIYRADLIRKSISWQEWLAARYVTRSLHGEVVAPPSFIPRTALQRRDFASSPASQSANAMKSVYVPRTLIYYKGP